MSSYQYSYDDPFNSPVEYNPTDNTFMQREQFVANRLLTPHSMVLQMLLSRFQAARYDRRELVLLILRLVLRSAMAFDHVRCVTPRHHILHFSLTSIIHSSVHTL
jgi:phosphatidylinositol 4-kinase